MAALTPCPLAPHLPLAAAVAHAPAGMLVGVWLRGAARPIRLLINHDQRPRVLLLDGDLGRLLRCCAVVAVRLGLDVRVVSAEELIHVRALRIVTGLPYLPTRGLDVPLHGRSAEEVLAAYATARVPILLSRVVYRRLRSLPGGG